MRKRDEFKEKVEDLLSWEEENDALLPVGMSAEEIAQLEDDGYIVDLATGAIIPIEDADNYGWPLL